MNCTLNNLGFCHPVEIAFALLITTICIVIFALVIVGIIGDFE